SRLFPQLLNRVTNGTFAVFFPLSASVVSDSRSTGIVNKYCRTVEGTAPVIKSGEPGYRLSFAIVAPLLSKSFLSNLCLKLFAFVEVESPGRVGSGLTGYR